LKAIKYNKLADNVFLIQKRLDVIDLIDKKYLIKDWWFLGPYDNSAGVGLDKVYLPEREMMLMPAKFIGNMISVNFLFDY